MTGHHASRHATLVALVLTALACSPTGRDTGGEETDGGNEECTNPDGCSTPTCAEGDMSCGEGGLYTCDADGTPVLTEECTCASEPQPHCEVELCPAGATFVCDGDAIRDCSSGASTSCNGGRCLMTADGPVCATKTNDPVCVKKDANGDEISLLCSSGDAVATDQICDWRTGKCASSTFACSRLTNVELDKVVCDSSGDFLSGCRNGQPAGIVCEGAAKCRNDGTLNCYTTSTAGQDCGGQTMCYPGLHCTQTSVADSICERPAAVLDCGANDVVSVCSDADTGVACVNGAVWWWENLRSWGGSCGEEPVIPQGGNCIPGLADCKAGLACEKTSFDVAGVCAPPRPGAPAECVLTHQVSTGRSCQYKWDSCLNGKQYTVSCQVQNVAGHVFTLCGCFIGSEKTKEFTGEEICQVEDLASLDRIAKEECGWSVSTTDVAGG